MLISRVGIQSKNNFQQAGQSARFASMTDPRLHPTAHERHGHEQRSAIALKLLFGYLNYRPIILR